MKTITKEFQTQITPDQALEMLKEGNKRFLNNQKASRDLLEQAQQTSKGQFPIAAILSCMDSRTSVELIFDQGIGDVFSIRIAGNIVNKDILGSLEFATKAAGSKVILVLGHTKCGAIVGACNNVQLGNLSTLLEKIKPATERVKNITDDRTGANPQFVSEVTKQNVLLAMEEIRSKSEIVAELEKEKKIKVVGGVYDIETGKVEFFE